MSEAVYILGGLRTPVTQKNGKMKYVRPEQMGAILIRALQKKYPLEQPDGIICGNAVGTGGNITRLMALTAGLPESVPALTVDVQCSSGAAAVALAYSQLAIGNGDVYLAGGIESASLQPLRVYDAKDERHTAVPDGNGAYYTAQFSPDELAPDAMLRGAERTMQTEKMSKAELDKWTLLSHRRAAAAQRDGILADIIVPVGECAADDGIRPKMSQRLLDRLPLIYGEGTLLTAGSSCLINDGAALAVLVSERWLKAHPDIKPQAKILRTRAAGGPPAESPRGAMHTADLLLADAGLTYNDLAAIEFNEAFGAIDVLFEREHANLIDRYNRLGGALAYGHPYGASGAILLLHLLKSLQAAGGGKGLLSIAGAGGMGQAILIETV